MTFPFPTFSPVPAAGDVWGVVRSFTLDSNRGGYNGYTTRYVFAVAGLTAPSGTVTKVRVTMEAGSTEALTVSALYIGVKAGSGDVYDFAATPTQLTWDGGSASKALSSGGSAVTDEVLFSWDKSTDIIIAAYYAGGTSADGVRATTSAQSNLSEYLKLSSDASTVNATGYSADTARASGIRQIEMTGF